MRSAILLSILLLSCGKIPLRQERSPILATGEFLGFVQLFADYAYEYGRPVSIDDLTVYFGDTKTGLPERAVGYCQLYTDGVGREIVIDYEFWSRSTIEGRALLMFHELGHCILMRDHVDYFSMMNPMLPPTGVFFENEEVLLTEFFEVKK